MINSRSARSGSERTWCRRELGKRSKFKAWSSETAQFCTFIDLFYRLTVLTRTVIIIQSYICKKKQDMVGRLRFEKLWREKLSGILRSVPRSLLYILDLMFQGRLLLFEVIVQEKLGSASKPDRSLNIWNMGTSFALVLVRRENLFYLSNTVLGI